MINIAVLVSGGGTNLQALIDATKSGIISSGKIRLVISSSSNAYALTRAKNANIDTAVVRYKSANVEQDILKLLQEYSIDLIVLAGFIHILSADFVSRYPKRIINIHPSLIPKFCGDGFYGLRVHQAVLDNHEEFSGATVHYVNQITDGGEIIMSKIVPVCVNDTAEILQQRIMEQAEWIILPEATEQVCKLLLNKGE
ncbi:MAG: phosphoribosylglycinamide formyltransferase [Clostridia bacterium]